jgi:hypothetical protein
MALIIIRRLPIILVMIYLAGCATSKHTQDATPPIQVSESTWRQVDSDIIAESRTATVSAKNFAREKMERWKQLAMQRAEADFIPWFSSYWTQQWLTARVAWYKLGSRDTRDTPVTRLAAYLQEQYHDRVLAPVAREVDPETVMAQATLHYIQNFGRHLQPMSRRYGIPQNLFERRLKDIPAIALGPPPARNASLFEIVSTDQIITLPAYVALLQQVRDAGREAGVGLSKTRISPVAMRVSEKMQDRLAISGGTSAVSGLVGGIASTVISLGAVGVGVLLHESERKVIETQLRETLNESMEDMWHQLMNDPNTGVMAGTYYLADQIEKISPQVFMQPIKLENPPQEIPLPDKTPPHGEMIDGESPIAELR